jgi:hypothetical protein
MSDGYGNILFYSDGDTVWNKLNQHMANGVGLMGSGSSTQGPLILKLPNSSDIYYLFTLSDNGATNGFRYSIVDMSLAAGLGSVTVKHVPIYSPSCEKIAAVQHCNGIDFWIITHDYNANIFRVYLFGASGLNATPVLSSAGSILGNGSIGQMKASPMGNKLVMISGGVNTVELFDFDNTTGQISNPYVLTNTVNPIGYGCEFSPDGSIIYASGNGGSVLYQWDLTVGSIPTVIATQYTLPVNSLYQLQLAMDGKIYGAINNTNYLAVINSPNALQSQMQFTLQALSLGTQTCYSGLPTLSNHLLRTAGIKNNYTVSCQNVTFTTNALLKQSTATYTAPSYTWNFGDPQSSSSNTSNLATPTHYYSTPGTYTAMFIYKQGCYADTIPMVVQVVNSYPTPSFTGTTTICKGERATIVAQGAYSYSWSSNATTNSISASPTINTTYSVVVTNTTNGCSLTKTVAITVNKCTGEDIQAKLTEVKIYPNPAQDYIELELEWPATITLFDVYGKWMSCYEFNQGHNRLQTTHLTEGFYFVKIKTQDQEVTKRLLIQR